MIKNINSTNCGSVNFGRFQDENARNVVRKELMAKKPSLGYMQPCYDGWFNAIESCDYFTAYTDEKTGVVKGRFDDEFINSDKAKKIKVHAETLKDAGELENLGEGGDPGFVGKLIGAMEMILGGADVFNGRRETEEDRRKRAAEERRIAEERIDYLAK